MRRDGSPTAPNPSNACAQWPCRFRSAQRRRLSVSPRASQEGCVGCGTFRFFILAVFSPKRHLWRATGLGEGAPQKRKKTALRWVKGAHFPKIQLARILTLHFFAFNLLAQYLLNSPVFGRRPVDGPDEASIASQCARGLWLHASCRANKTFMPLFPRRFRPAPLALLAAALIASAGLRAGDLAPQNAESGPKNGNFPRPWVSDRWRSVARGMEHVETTLWREDQARVAQACPDAVDDRFERLDALNSLSPPSAECLRAASGLHSALAAPWALSIARVHVDACFATPGPDDQQTSCARGWAVFGSVASFRGARVSALRPFDALAQALSQEASALEGPASSSELATLEKQTREARSTDFFLALLSREQVLRIVQALREHAPAPASETIAKPPLALPAKASGPGGAQ